MNTKLLRDYFESLATLHKGVRHGEGGKCHFSSLTDEAQNNYAGRMHYPCVVLNLGDLQMAGPSTYPHIEREVSLLFLDHAEDTGDYDNIRDIFDNTEKIMGDFLGRMIRDSRNGVKAMSRFHAESESHQIYLESAGLYGWILTFPLAMGFNPLDCDGVFSDGK